MQDMKGSITLEEREYRWWAGNASPGAETEYCVHCRRDELGVTRYIDEKPSRERAEAIANELAPMVDRLN